VGKGIAKVLIQFIFIRIAVTLNGIEEAGTFKHERIITSMQNAEVKVRGNDDSVLNFCANNYLGLSSHPKVELQIKSTRKCWSQI